MASPLVWEKGHTVVHENFTVSLVLGSHVYIGGFVLLVVVAGGGKVEKTISILLQSLVQLSAQAKYND